MDLLTNIWTIKQEWDSEWAKTKVAKFRDLDTDDMDEMAAKFQKRVMRLKTQIMNWPIWQKMKADIDVFRAMMPLITDLRHEAMRDRHWVAIMEEVNELFDPHSENFTLNKVFELRLNTHAELIA